MESYSICEWLGDKIKRPLHLYDTWGLHIVQGFESGLVGLDGGVISIMLFRILQKVVACLMIRPSSFEGLPSKGSN